MINVNSLINNYMNFLELCENIIKEVKPDSMEDIATKLDIKYNGIQEGYKKYTSYALIHRFKNWKHLFCKHKSKRRGCIESIK